MSSLCFIDGVDREGNPWCSKQAGHEGTCGPALTAMPSKPGEGVICECERGPVAVAAFKRNTSLLIRRMGDMGHHSAADWWCIDCVAEMAAEVAACPIRSFHPDFQPNHEES